MKRPDAFTAVLTALRAVYDAEIARLADEYRARILAGEFSGTEDEGRGGPCHLRLERDLAAKHPWLASDRGRMVVFAVSRWLENEEKALTDPRTGETIGGSMRDNFSDGVGAECMAHDVLDEAARRGWVKRMRFMNSDEAYGLRVA